MSEVVGTQTLVKARTEGTSLINPLKREVENVTITDAADYAAADQLLSRIMSANKAWQGKVNPIIKPVYDALQLLYALKNDFKEPLDDYEKIVKAKMKTYKLEEARLLRAEEEERQRRIDESNRISREKEEAAAKARTKQMREKLTTQSAEAAQTASTLEIQGPAEAVRVEGSTVRTKRKAEVTDLKAFLRGILTGEIPDDLITINQVELNSAYRIDAKIVSEWPGISIVEDIDITGRRR